MSRLRTLVEQRRRRIPPAVPPVDDALAADPVQLAVRAGITLDDWQSDVLRSRELQTILLCSRQSGKSTVTSFIGLHEAFTQAHALVLILSPSLRQSGELFAKIKAALSALDSVPVPVVRETADTLEFANGARIICLPSSEGTIRGFSGVTLLLVDEASRVPDPLYQAVRPMLAVSGGRLILLSTPWGKRGFFHHEWTEGQGWKRVQVTAYDCPRISDEWLEAERAAIGDWWFSQEYLCQFVDTEDQVFGYEYVMAAVDATVTPLFGGSAA